MKNCWAAPGASGVELAYRGVVRASELLAAVALLAALPSCEALQGKKERARSSDCEEKECPKCPSPSKSSQAASSADPARSGPEGAAMCTALTSFAAAIEGARVVYGDVELNRNGIVINDGDILADAMIRAGGAETAEPSLNVPIMLVHGKQELYSTTALSLPRAKERRKDLEKYLIAGRLPEPSTTPEIVLGHKLMKNLGVERGGELSVAAVPNLTVPSAIAPLVKKIKVVGVLDLPGDPVLDYDGSLAMMEVDDVRAISLVPAGSWSAVRVWYRAGERAAGVLKIQDALRAQQLINFVTIDQSLTGLTALRPTLELICAER